MILLLTCPWGFVKVGGGVGLACSCAAACVLFEEVCEGEAFGAAFSLLAAVLLFFLNVCVGKGSMSMRSVSPFFFLALALRSRVASGLPR
jgi:hypothetical protein